MRGRLLFVPVVGLLSAAWLPAGAGATLLRLTDSGERVAAGTTVTAINETVFPGFTCRGRENTALEGNPAPRRLLFASPGEGPFYYECKTAGGEELSLGEEVIVHYTHLTIHEGGVVTEKFSPSATFIDTESGCRWALPELQGTLPESHLTEGIDVTGKLHRLLESAKGCPASASAHGTVSIKPYEEAAGQFLVEEIP
jgi:hypothetical protein